MQNSRSVDENDAAPASRAKGKNTSGYADEFNRKFAGIFTAAATSGDAPTDPMESCFKLALGALALKDYDEAARIGAMYREQAARIERAAAPAPTDISRRLRAALANCGPAATLGPLRADILAAVDEIERYYGGMMAWKRTAEAKDREFAEARAAVSAATRPAGVPPSWDEWALSKSRAFVKRTEEVNHPRAMLVSAIHCVLIEAMEYAAPIAAPAEQVRDAEAKRYRAAIETVCEGWTLPADARKLLEKVLWSGFSVLDESAPDGAQGEGA